MIFLKRVVLKNVCRRQQKHEKFHSMHSIIIYTFDSSYT